MQYTLALIIDSTQEFSSLFLSQFIFASAPVLIFILLPSVTFFHESVRKSKHSPQSSLLACDECDLSQNYNCYHKEIKVSVFRHSRNIKMAEKSSEPSVPSIRSLQSDSGIDSEGQPGSVGVSPPSSYFMLFGYPKEIFKKPPRDSDLCGICNNVTRWPVQTDCGCGLFCHGCLYRHIGWVYVWVGYYFVENMTQSYKSYKLDLFKCQLWCDISLTWRL